MASYFNAEYYFAAKAKQLSTTEKTWTAAEVQAEFAKQGINAEDHYKAYGASEGLSPNAYFNEKEYLASKLAALQDTDPTWANKTVTDLQAEFKALGINAADHYEQYGAFETRKDGTLLNPSNAFDANAYFAAKLAQLQKSGFEGADTMTVADVVKAVQEAGISPVAHLQAYGAAEAKTDGIPLVQTVPVAQRVPNDPIRAEFGELVPSNFNPPSKAPAAAVAAPVTKPADVGGLSANKPVIPTAPVKVPGDAGYIAPPANLVDTNEKPVLPPTTTEGTGPNAGFIIVDKETGKGTVVKPDGTIQGEVVVEVKPDGTVTPPAPNAPVEDKDGNNTNDKPADNTGKPVEPTPPTVDPEPENPDVGPPAPVLDVSYTGPEDAPTKAIIEVSNNVATKVTLSKATTGSVYTLTPDGGAAPIPLKAGFTGDSYQLAKNVTLVAADSTLLSGKTVIGAGALELTDSVISADRTIDASKMEVTVTATFQEVSGSSAKTLTYSGGSGVDNVFLKAQDTSGDYSNLKLVANLGAGNDSITVELGANGISFASDSTLDGGSGSDTLNITGAASESGVLKFHADDSLKGIEKIDFSGVTVGDGVTVGLDLSNQTEVFEVTGSANNDYIVGSAKTDTLAGGAGGADFLRGFKLDDGLTETSGGSGGDIIFAGSITEKVDEVYGESQKTAPSGYNSEFLELFNGNRDGTTSKWLSDAALKQFKDATILEGRVDNDTLIASNQKDVFLFQTGKGTVNAKDELNAAALGTDTIHKFNVETDIIFLMNQSDKAASGANDFSAGWKFADSTASGSGSVFTSTATATGKNSVTGEVKVVFDTVKNTATITIADGLLSNDASNETLTIKLVGVQGLSDSTTVADFFGGEFTPVA